MNYHSPLPLAMLTAGPSVGLQAASSFPLQRPSFTFDQIVLLSDVSASRLRQVLPKQALRSYCHSFRIDAYGAGLFGAYESKVSFVYPSNIVFWNIMAANEHLLGNYVFTKLELAFDFTAHSAQEAQYLRDFIAIRLLKPWHSLATVNTYVVSGSQRPGCIAGPTHYFEKKKSQTGLKVYARYKKLPGGLYDQTAPVCRVEYTLNSAANILRKTGITTISDIHHFNSADFYERYFRLSEVNLVALGTFLQPGKPNPAAIATAHINQLVFPGHEHFQANLIGMRPDVPVAVIRGDIMEQRRIARNGLGRQFNQRARLAKLHDRTIKQMFPIVTGKYVL